MTTQGDPTEICREIADELRDMATWLTAGQLSPEQFRAAVLTLEEAKVKRFGFTLSGSVAQTRCVEFELRFADSRQLCARMEFDPRKGELATEHLCA